MHVWFDKLVGKIRRCRARVFSRAAAKIQKYYSLWRIYESSLSLQKVVQPFEVLKNLSALTRACLWSNRHEYGFTCHKANNIRIESWIKEKWLKPVVPEFFVFARLRVIFFLFFFLINFDWNLKHACKWKLDTRDNRTICFRGVIFASNEHLCSLRSPWTRLFENKLKLKLC